MKYVVVVIIIVVVVVVNCKWVYTQQQCTTMQDRTIQYYNTHHTSHKSPYNTQGNTQTTKLQEKIRNTYHTLLRPRNM